MTAGVSEATPMLENGQCKVLFTLTDERIYDDVPTLKELGYDSVSLSSDRGLAMHGETDPTIVQYWSDIMDKVCADTAFLEEAAAQSLIIHHRNSAEFTEYFSKLYDFWYDLKNELGE
jgi:tripartite-type tricarboxylate transporter receptor subunit TctC